MSRSEVRFVCYAYCREWPRVPVPVRRHSGSRTGALVRFTLVIEEHPIMRDANKRRRSEQPVPVSFGEAATAAEARDCVMEHEWDIAILDLSLSGSSGLELLHELRRLRPRLPILVLTMHALKPYARRAF